MATRPDTGRSAANKVVTLVSYVSIKFVIASFKRGVLVMIKAPSRLILSITLVVTLSGCVASTRLTPVTDSTVRLQFNGVSIQRDVDEAGAAGDHGR